MADKTATRQMAEPKTLVLKRSDVTVVYDAGFVAGDTIAAQRAAGKDAHKFGLYLLQRVATFNGAAWSAQEIEERLKGMDYLTLQGAILGGDEADAGNA